MPSPQGITSCSPTAGPSRCCAASCPDAKVGITLDLIPMHPLTGSEADAAAARLEDATRNRWFLDPILRGEYPADGARAPRPAAARRAPPTTWRRSRSRSTSSASTTTAATSCRPTRRAASRRSCSRRAASSPAWAGRSTPTRCTSCSCGSDDEYDVPPLYITENGAAFADRRSNGHVDDPRRSAYIERHLDAVARAIDDGVPVAGYFVWSLLDNFEWHQGYSQRFGLVYVDFETLERVPKASYAWYRDFIAAQRNGHESRVAPLLLADGLGRPGQREPVDHRAEREDRGDGVPGRLELGAVAGAALPDALLLQLLAAHVAADLEPVRAAPAGRAPERVDAGDLARRGTRRPRPDSPDGYQ